MRRIEASWAQGKTNSETGDGRHTRGMYTLYIHPQGGI